MVLSTANTIYDYYNEDRKKTKYSLPSAGSPSVPKVSFFQCNFTDYDSLSTSIVDISQLGRNSWYTTEYEAHQLIGDMDELSRQFQEDLTSTADFYNAVRTAIRNVPSSLEYNELKKFNNKLVSYLGQIYSVKFTKNGSDRKHLNPGTTSTVTTKVRDFLNSNNLVVQDDLTNADVEIKIDYTVPAYSVQFEVYTEGNYKCTIPAGTGRTKLSNQPYSMFCMPWENFYANVANLSAQFSTSGEANRCIAQAIAEKFSKTALIDLQLLPYCPLQTQLVRNDLNNYTIYHTKFTESARQVTPIYKTVGGTDTIVSYLYWADSADFTFDIDLITPISAPNDPIEFKVSNQVDFYRLCSPNYNGQFEFSATKNDGVRWFNVDCTYKPYSPYIHVNPYFRGLYGADFNDARGLICSGDFSLPQSSDAWSNYEINNKNFENIFKTNISLLEENNKYAKYQDIFNAITGTVGGAGSGAITGSMIAPGLGTAVGAVGGGVASAVGGIANAIINPMLREHQLQAQKDIHQFELQNIQAVPDSLTKVGALNFNNKIFPFLEYYTCTDEEKEAVRNLLKWYNMKIGRIGVIEDFINPEYNYIQANIIKIELNEDFHMAESIKEAVSGGLYFGKDEE